MAHPSFIDSQLPSNRQSIPGWKEAGSSSVRLIWQSTDVKRGREKGDGVQSEGSRCFLHRAARVAFGVSPDGALCAAELQIISLVLYGFSFNRCWQRGRAEVEISTMRGTTPSQPRGDPPLCAGSGSREAKKLIGKKFAHDTA